MERGRLIESLRNPENKVSFAVADNFDRYVNSISKLNFVPNILSFEFLGGFPLIITFLSMSKLSKCLLIRA